MSRRLSERLLTGALVALALCAARPALALEPQTVSSEGVVAVGSSTEPPPRDAAFQAALVAAVFQVARGLVPPERFEREAERLRTELGPQAQSFVLTYRTGGPLTRRPSKLDPGVSEWVLPVTARIDTNQLRAWLVRTGFVREAGERPSLVLRVRPTGEISAAPPVGALSHLQQTLRAKLEEQQFVLVESALREGDESEPRSALELARGVGADVGVDLDVTWRPNPQVEGGVSGGVAEVRARALRSDDGSELAIARFEAAGYDARREEAIAQALLAVEPQLALNLGQQLERNWQAQTTADRPVDLDLESVSSLVQVGAVRRALLGPLAAKSAEIRELRAGGATLQVVSALSAGAAGAAVEPALSTASRPAPVEAGAGRARMRVELAAPRRRHCPGAGHLTPQSRNSILRSLV
jgi:hypothetical protein